MLQVGLDTTSPPPWASLMFSVFIKNRQVSVIKCKKAVLSAFVRLQGEGGVQHAAK